MTTVEAVKPTTSRPQTSGAIDCDCHPHFKEGVRDLAPYLDETWKARMGVGTESWAKGLPASEFRLPHPWYVNPGGGMRVDAVPPDGGPPNSDPAYTVVEHLDRFDLGASVLLGGHVLGISGFADGDLAAAIAAAYNHWVIERWCDVDSRFKGSILVAPQNPERAAEEVDKWAGDDRMVQVFIPNMHESFGKRHFWPIYEVAEHHGLPVATHPGAEAAGINGPMTAVDVPSYYMDWHTSLDQVYQRHAISLVAEGTFEQFPRLKFGLIEGGFAWLPAVMWKMDKNWKGLREEVPWLTRLPSEYMIDHIRVTTQPMPEPPKKKHLHYIFEMMHADKMLMFATDYPHWDGDSPDFALRMIPKELHHKVMVETPMDYYRMPEA